MVWKRLFARRLCGEKFISDKPDAGLMMDKGNFTKAEELFKKALKLNPGYPRTYYGLALLFYNQ